MSTLVCYHVFFKKWLNACLDVTAPTLTAKLGKDFSFQPKLSFHLPVEITNVDGSLWARPGFGTNSGDAVSLSKATGIITLPAKETDFKKGDKFELVMF